MFFDTFISTIKTSVFFAKLRKIKYRTKRKKMHEHAKLSLSEMRTILIDKLSISTGDSIMIHCGFGFLNASFSPIELIELLKDIIGKNGNIMMPFYPPGSSSDWAQSGRVFDPKKIKCSTGVLAQTFSKRSDTYFSIHPIKPVIVWGKDAKSLVQGHENTKYPFDKTSPYYSFTMLPNSKTIGLGVLNCAMAHCSEDIHEKNKGYLYVEMPIELPVVTDEQTVLVSTYYHHGNSKSNRHSFFLNNYSPDDICLQQINDVTYYSIDNKKLMDFIAALLGGGMKLKS